MKISKRIIEYWVVIQHVKMYLYFGGELFPKDLRILIVHVWAMCRSQRPSWLHHTIKKALCPTSRYYLQVIAIIIHMISKHGSISLNDIVVLWWRRLKYAEWAEKCGTPTTRQTISGRDEMFKVECRTELQRSSDSRRNRKDGTV